jgi:hypothetical protein
MYQTHAGIYFIMVNSGLTLHFTADLSKVNRVAAYYLMATSFYAIIWCASRLFENSSG